MRSYFVDKPIIIKGHAVKYFTNLASHQPLQNRTIPPAFRNANIYMHDTLSHSHYPLPRTKLASLVKGEVLSPDKIRATTGGIATPPFLASHQPLQNRTIPPAFRNANIYMHDTLSNSHYPLPRTKLASPRKRGGGTADTIFSLAVQYSDIPAFIIQKLFRAVTVGIVNA